jgi:hypothetical protein
MAERGWGDDCTKSFNACGEKEDQTFLSLVLLTQKKRPKNKK